MTPRLICADAPSTAFYRCAPVPQTRTTHKKTHEVSQCHRHAYRTRTRKRCRSQSEENSSDCRSYRGIAIESHEENVTRSSGMSAGRYHRRTTAEMEYRVPQCITTIVLAKYRRQSSMAFPYEMRRGARRVRPPVEQADGNSRTVNSISGLIAASATYR